MDGEDRQDRILRNYITTCQVTVKQTSQRTKQKYNDACISYAVQGRAKTKGKLWVFAAILTLCGLVVSTSCSSKDDPVESGGQEYTGVSGGPTEEKR